ncbi:F-box protein GID2-like [Carya illinoinensis]|nr:F-box protein GID2-like [Carya illinoinensis]
MAITLLFPFPTFTNQSIIHFTLPISTAGYSIYHLSLFFSTTHIAKFRPTNRASAMKRALMADDAAANTGEDKKMKRIRVDEEEENGEKGIGFVNLDENLLYEVLKHVDARTLAVASCVSKLWHRTAQDERLWELICTRDWANIGCANQQLRSVVLALGGFRRLYSLYIWPLYKSQSSGSSSSLPSSSSCAPFGPMMGSKLPTRWGKDEVHLSLSLFSIRYYEKMNFKNGGR